ncbi:MAG TPA: hypothetical protein VIM51_04185 [Desulfosporosinus sp.]
MAVTIEESGMTFGPFSEEQIFYVEKSDIYNKLQNGLPIAEFLLIQPDKNLLLVVEAKSSSPNPSNMKSQLQFDEFITEISRKLLNAFALGLTLCLGRHVDNIDELSNSFQEIDYASVTILFLLVINGHKDEWLAPVNEALQRELKDVSKIWPLKVITINEKAAKKYNLIQ